MQSADKLLRWLVLGLPFPLVVLNGWLVIRVFHYFQALITIFITATLLAFVLNYPVQFFQEKGLKRGKAALLVAFLALTSLIGLGVTLVPILLTQLNDLIKLLPTWIDSGSQQLQAISGWAIARGLPINLSTLDTQLTERLPEELENFTGQAVDFALGTVSSISEIILAVVLAFYLLLDGDSLWKQILQWLPPNLSLQVQISLKQNFENYFIGQVTVASILGISITSAFLVLKVPFALLFGLGIGLVALFPFGDTVSYLLVSLLIASHNFGLGVKVLAVAILIDQIVDNGIAPRVLGGFTGLRPLWIFVSLLVGASLGGVLGLFIAVPVAGFLKTTVDKVNADQLSQPTG
jgi:predicted PurR-regulated permease PerM